MKIKALAICILLTVAGAVEAVAVDPSGSIIVDTGLNRICATVWCCSTCGEPVYDLGKLDTIATITVTITGGLKRVNCGENVWRVEFRVWGPATVCEYEGGQHDCAGRRVMQLPWFNLDKLKNAMFVVDGRGATVDFIVTRRIRVGLCSCGHVSGRVAGR